MRDLVVAPVDASATVRAAAAELARELRLRLVRSIDDAGAAPMILVVTADHVELREASAPRRAALVVDFADIDLRRGSGNLSKKQPLVRAFGSSVATILDATAGLGHDAFLLACCGFEVTGAERNPVVFALLRDGVRRATEDARMSEALDHRLNVVHADSHETLARSRPDAVYIDPMFPPKRRKSALAKKSIRLVRELVGDDEDADELLAAALRHARDRVVVKRPSYAPPLGGEPALTFEGKLARYDVYLVGRGGA